MNDGIFKSDFMVLKSNCNNNMQLWGLIKKFVDWCNEIKLIKLCLQILKGIWNNKCFVRCENLS